MASTSDAIRTTSISFLVITWIAVLLRCFVRVHVKKCFGHDDVLMVVSFVFFICFIGVLIDATHHGLGRHFADIVSTSGVAGFGDGVKRLIAAELLYVFTTCLIKISLSLTLLRLTITFRLILCVYTVIGATLIFTTFYFSFILSMCSPVSFAWTRYLDASGGSCRESAKLAYATYAHGVVMACVDIALAVIPLLLVKDLSLGRVQKFYVIGLLGFGSLTSVATIARLPYVTRMVSEDTLWGNSNIAIWSVVETGFSLLAICAAMLRPLYKEVQILSKSSRQLAKRLTNLNHNELVTTNDSDGDWVHDSGGNNLNALDKQYSAHNNSIHCVSMKVAPSMQVHDEENDVV